eukprot:3504400-Prymnesium_polylepis.1
MEFAAAAAALLGADAARADPALLAPPRHLRIEAIAAALRPFTVSLVTRLATVLVHSPSGRDVTGPGAASADAPWFVCRERKEVLLLASPPAGLSLAHSLGQAVGELLGCAPPAGLAPLLGCAPAESERLLGWLRVSPPTQWQVRGRAPAAA